MTITWTGLLPHPPIIVPTVGGARCTQAQKTIDACRALAASLVAHKADRVILLSPHTERPASGISTWTRPKIRGDFANFGAPQQQLEFANDLAWLDCFRSFYPTLQEVKNQTLDHGAAVPLYFLATAGWCGPICVLGLPWAGASELHAIGYALKLASANAGRTAVLASGDMSHCLLAEGPYGFHPQGPVFDKQFVDAIQKGAYLEAEQIGSSIREPAKEDVVDSSIIAWSATEYAHSRAEFMSYEGPFGVGYAVMKYFEQQP